MMVSHKKIGKLISYEHYYKYRVTYLSSIFGYVILSWLQSGDGSLIGARSFDQGMVPVQSENRPLIETFGHNILTSGPRFLGGVFLATFILLYLPRPALAAMFGGTGVWEALIGAVISIPLNVCGAGTILLLRQWMARGMSMGCAAAFMLVGPAMKLSSLRKVRHVSGSGKQVAVYVIFIFGFALIIGSVIR